jgi:hypothetical protein
MNDRFSIVGLAMILALTLPSKSLFALDAVQFEARTDCLAAEAVREKLGRLLAQYDIKESLSVALVVDPATSGRVISLRVIVNRTGAVILDRHFNLQVQDCPSALDLLTAVLERFLVETPAEQWLDSLANPVPLLPPPPPPPEKILVMKDMAELAGMAFVSVDSRWVTPSADLELGTAIDVGSSSHRLIGSAAVRLGLPRALGTGHYLEASALLGVGWRYASQNWMLRMEVRTGGLLVSGYGYQNDYHDWVLWLEFQSTLAWNWRGVLFGPLIAVSVLRHEVLTTLQVSEQLPWLRIGFFVGFPYWYKRF